MFGIDSREKVKDVVAAYEHVYRSPDEGVHERRTQYEQIVNDFYNLVTEFYEFGWGQSFHFAPRHSGESFAASISRQEMYLALRLQLHEGKECADLGSGIGGPMRCIARFSKAVITGVNNNEFQIQRTLKLNTDQHLTHLTKSVKADFMKLPIADNTFDAAYQSEAFCHAPDKKAVYSEALRILKPGGLFAGYEWCITPKFDRNNPVHRDIVFGIERGNGITPLDDFQTEIEAVKAAGFEVVTYFDKALDPESDIPWWNSLAGQYSLVGFKHTPLGRKLTNWMVWGLEKAHIAPQGSLKIHSVLCQTADDLARGGQMGIFTPMFFVLARKPLK